MAVPQTQGARTPDAQRRAASRRAMSFKFEHIVFNVCTHTGGAIRRLSAAHSNDCLERCSRRGAARRGAARSVCEPLQSLSPFFELESAHLKVPSVSGMHVRALS